MFALCVRKHCVSLCAYMSKVFGIVYVYGNVCVCVCVQKFVKEKDEHRLLWQRRVAGGVDPNDATTRRIGGGLVEGGRGVDCVVYGCVIVVDHVCSRRHFHSRRRRLRFIVERLWGVLGQHIYKRHPVFIGSRNSGSFENS